MQRGEEEVEGEEMGMYATAAAIRNIFASAAGGTSPATEPCGPNSVEEGAPLDDASHFNLGENFFGVGF